MPTIIREVHLCPVGRLPKLGKDLWVNCPSMEPTSTPDGAPNPASPYGCGGDEPSPHCVSEVREVELQSNAGLLEALFPDFRKLPRDTAQCPLIIRGQIEELHSSERLLFAIDTEETHLIRLYLLLVTYPNAGSFYWPVGFEVEGYRPGLQLPVVYQLGGLAPEYSVEFSSMTFDVLVQRNR